MNDYLHVIRSIITAVSDAVCVVDDDQIIMSNEACCALLGYMQQDILGRHICTLFTPEYHALFTKPHSRYRLQSAECRTIRRDGNILSTKVTRSPLHIGQRSLFIIALQDITASSAWQLLADQHIAELDYLAKTASTLIGHRTSEDLYHYIGEQVSTLAGSSVVFVATCNECACKHLTIQAVVGHASGMTDSYELFGQSLTGASFEFDNTLYTASVCGDLITIPGGIHALFADHLSEDLCRQFERDGDIRVVYACPLKSGAEYYGVIVVAMRGQITPQQPALMLAFINQTAIALQRLRAETCLERERAYLSASIDLLPIPLSFISPEGQVERRNQAMHTLLHQLGVPDEFSWHYLDPMTHVRLPHEPHALAQALEGVVTSGKELVLSTEAVRELPVVVHAAPIAVDGEVVAAVGAIADVSALKAADKAKDEFLAVLAHELQTPLTAMLGWSQIACAHDDPMVTSQAMEVVHRNAKRQERLINELLDVSRLVHNKMSLLLQPLDLQIQVAQAIETIIQEAERHQLTIRTDCQTGQLLVMADPQRIQQCLCNLLQNSLKFTPAGGMITVASYRDNQWGVVRIQDTGCGIPADKINRLFRPFTQLEQTNAAQGMGLGLAITHGIIALHNGEIAIASDGINTGCTVTIKLPAE